VKDANGQVLLILSGLKIVGFGYFSRKDAKTLSSEKKIIFSYPAYASLPLRAGHAFREIFPYRFFRENSETVSGYSLFHLA
jgi:hypothetical protein